MDEELLMQNFCLISPIAADEAAQWLALIHIYEPTRLLIIAFSLDGL